MEDRSKRTETVRPQFGERCEKQSECDSALSAKKDENDVELNGETDDEDMDGETTAHEHQEHMTTHRPYRSWCQF